jgi:hypothetical protein
MGQDESQVGPGVEERGSDDRGPEEIREEIEETRAEMGDTVEALASKADVKGQAQQKIDEVKQTALAKKEALLAKAKQASPDSASGGGAQERAQQLKATAQENPMPLAVGGALVLGFLLGRRRRS